MNRERFIVSDAKGESDDRKFANGKCICNTRLGMAYSVDETVEVLNSLGTFGDFLSELVQTKIWYCQGMFKDTGDEKYLIEEQCLKTLRDESYDRSSYEKYTEYLKKRHQQYIDENRES